MRAKLGWGLTLLLTVPPLAFLAFAFLFPIAQFLFQSVDNTTVVKLLPRTVVVLRTWDGVSAVPDAAFGAMAADLAELQSTRRTSQIARRMSQVDPEFRDLLTEGARVAEGPAAEARQRLVAAEPGWDDPRYWHMLRSESGVLTWFYLAKTVGLTTTAADGSAVAVDSSSVYPAVFLRTFVISISVVILCALLAYPVAYALYWVSDRWVGYLMVLILIPFWMSLLVRTSAWVMILQDQGVANQLLRWMHVIDAPVPLIFNRVGVLVTLTHVLLPYMVLPLYATMRSIPRTQVQAGLSLGAGPLRTFFRVFLPQTIPGAAAGGIFVFILSIGYYVTPLLVGGPTDQMIGYFIGFFASQTINWGQAAALSLVLIVATIIPLAALGRRARLAFGGSA